MHINLFTITCINTIKQIGFAEKGKPHTIKKFSDFPLTYQLSNKVKIVDSGLIHIFSPVLEAFSFL